jgi:endonuclease/exonuclease/phosphatase family metal-dependent hydrolase
MDHGRLDRKTAQGLKVLRQRIEKANIPPTQLDETLKIATWNIRDFGKKARRKTSIHFIAEILFQFDIVAVVELRDNLNDLKMVLDILGPDWSIVFSDFNTDAAGNRERIAYVFDKRAVTFTGLASEADPPRRKVKGKYLPGLTWWRSPFMASFRAGNFDFILMTVHIRWGSGVKARVAPLKMLAEWIHDRRNEQFVYDKDIILLGDFNIPSRRSTTFKAITSKGLRIPPGLLKTDFATNLARNKRYDQILHYPVHKSLFTGRGGVLDFYEKSHRRLYPGTRMSKSQFTYELSDHIPLWLQIDSWTEDIKLSQILRRR